MPCGTPERTLLELDRKPSTETYCRRLERKEEIQLKSGPWMPVLFILERRSLGSTLSKVFFLEQHHFDPY